MPDAPQDGRELTLGEKYAGVNFNPGGNPKVTAIKAKFATLIDDLDAIKNDSASGEVKRMASVAITELQTAQMWAVKAVTWQH